MRGRGRGQGGTKRSSSLQAASETGFVFKMSVGLVKVQFPTQQIFRLGAICLLATVCFTGVLATVGQNRHRGSQPDQLNMTEGRREPALFTPHTEKHSAFGSVIIHMFSHSERARLFINFYLPRDALGVCQCMITTLQPQSCRRVKYALSSLRSQLCHRGQNVTNYKLPAREGSQCRRLRKNPRKILGKWACQSLKGHVEFLPGCTYIACATPLPPRRSTTIVTMRQVFAVAQPVEVTVPVAQRLQFYVSM